MKNGISVILMMMFCAVIYAVFDNNLVGSILKQIDDTEAVLSDSLQIANDHIATFQHNSPLFAPKDPFESDAQYLRRKNSAIEPIKQIRDKYVYDIGQELINLRTATFITTDLIINLGAYNPNDQIYPITIKHNGYQKETYEVFPKVENSFAKNLYQNWDLIVKKGVLSINLANEICLAKVFLTDPISGKSLEFDFQKVLSVEDISDSSVAFSHDGQYIAFGSNNWPRGFEKIRIVNINTKKAILNIDQQKPTNSVAFSPDGKYLATACDDGKARIYDIKTSSLISEFEHYTQNKSSRTIHNVISVSISPDGTLLATGSSTLAKIFNMKTRQLLAEFEHEYGVNSVSFSPDGKFLATGCGTYDAGRTSVFDVTTRKLIHEFIQDDYVESVSFSPNGRYLASGRGSRYGTSIASMFDLATNNKVMEFTYSSYNSSVCISPNGKYLAVTTDNYRTVPIYSIETGQRIMEIESRDRDISFSPDGRYLAIGGTVYRTFQAIKAIR